MPAARRSILAALCAAALCAACSSPARTEIRPGSTTIERETSTQPPETYFQRQTTLQPDGAIVRTESQGATPGQTIVRDRAQATGPGLHTTADEIAQTFTGAPSTVTLGEAQGSAGGLESALKARGFNVGRIWPLVIMGGLLIVAGVGVALVLRPPQPSPGATLAGVGLLLCLGAVYESLALVAILVGAVGLVAYVVVRARRSDRYKTTLDTIIRAVDQAPPDAAQAVRAEVSKLDTDETRRVVRERKAVPR